jgi:large subunit ribosomal protein L4
VGKELLNLMAELLVTKLQFRADTGTVMLKNRPDLDVGKTVLVVDEKVSRNLELSARNVPGCDLLRQHKVHPYDVLSHERLLISESALKRLQESLR